MHHALYATIKPVFERGFVFDSYANRCGKRQGHASGGGPLRKLPRPLLKVGASAPRIRPGARMARRNELRRPGGGAEEDQGLRMRAWKSLSLSPVRAATTVSSSGDSAKPGASAGNPAETSMPRDDRVWRTVFARPSVRPAAWPCPVR